MTLSPFVCYNKSKSIIEGGIYLEIQLKISKKFTSIQLKIYYILIQHAKTLIKNNIKIKDSTLNVSIFLFCFDFEEKDLKDLREITIKINDNKKNWQYLSLLSNLKKEEDFYCFEFSSFIMKLIKNNQINNLLNAIAIKSFSRKYSESFYNFFLEYKNEKFLKKSIKDIREFTNTEKIYKDIKDFRIKVLDTACKEISEKTDLDISYKTEKLGKRVVFINFEINNKYNLNENLDSNKENINLLKEVEDFLLIRQEDNLLSKK